MKNISKSLIDRLLDGEKVICEACVKSYYKPLNPDAKVNHYYKCPECGNTIHFDPVVDID